MGRATREAALVHLTRVLADYTHGLSLDALPLRTREMVSSCIVDLLGATIAGHGQPGPVAIRASAGNTFGSGSASIWMTGRTASLLAAVFANSAAASALDLDDGNRAARGHPGAAIIPAVLTAADVSGRTATRDVVPAIVAGYEIGVRIAAAQNPEGIATRQTGRWASFATVAALGRLYRVVPDKVAQGLAIAGVLAPNQQANGSSGYSRMTGNDVKEGIAWSAALGVQALFLAMEGFTGPLDLLDHSGYYDDESIRSGLGQRFKIEDTYFKPWSCCRYIHPALDALDDVMQQYRPASERIAAIDVATFSWALRLDNDCEPETLVSLQYSLPYCLAAAVIEGSQSLAPATAGLLGRNDIADLARKVSLTVDREAERDFPARTRAGVAVVMVDGSRFETGLVDPLGDPARPMSKEGITEKFRFVTRHVIGPQKQQALIDGVKRVGDGDAGELLDALRDRLLFRDYT
ncbi:MmgE/PrpD family protein [Rhizobium daejeonense]|uniref:MmgE/PrpD family protein n=1 Tax=Rhizobium daejeonense TaxID=240521 RepID=UPI001FEBE47F|nr:MmgE/PrpD family protein [Rhizobium daejeonense]